MNTILWIRYLLGFFLVLSIAVSANMLASQTSEEIAVKKAALKYIESQHNPSAKRMAEALYPELAKRTYRHKKDGQLYIVETSFDVMLRVAETYNKKGDRFPDNPRKEIKILDIDHRVASVKLIADDFIDYMHLIKGDNGEWKIINVLWQYHDHGKHD